MLLGSIKRLELIAYIDDSINMLISEVLSYLKEGKSGKLKLSEEGAFVIITDDETKPIEECKLEYHKKYMDVQLLLEGEEVIGYSHCSPCDISGQFKNDVGFVENVSDENFVKLTSGCFAIFYPMELHRPLCCSHEPMRIKKAIIKIPIN